MTFLKQEQMFQTHLWQLKLQMCSDLTSFTPKLFRLHLVRHELKGTHWLMSSSFSTLAKVATLFFSRYR